MNLSRKLAQPFRTRFWTALSGARRDPDGASRQPSSSPFLAHDDPLAAALAAVANPNPGAPTRSEMREAANLLRAEGDEAQDEASLAKLLALVGRYPRVERLQILAARLLERSPHRSKCLAVWEGIHSQFPMSDVPFARSVRWRSRVFGVESAYARLVDRFPVLPDDTNELHLYAAGFLELNEFGLADDAHEKLLSREAHEERTYLRHSLSVEKRGDLERAVGILKAGKSALQEPTPHLDKALARLNARAQDIISRFPEIVAGGSPSADTFLRRLIDELIERRATRHGRPSFVGTTMLVTGSLGAGGAERQLVVTAGALQEAIASGSPIGGHPVFGPLSVVCRSLRSRPNADFFLRAVTDRGIPVSEYEDVPPYAGQERHSILLPYGRYLEFLSPQIVRGTTILADLFRFASPDIVHIWQDGMVLSAGIAALVANVPRIVLSTRTMPPVDRLGRNKPEYAELYRGLLRAPGVVLTANSRRAAARYSEWLGLAPERIHVIYNGVETPSAKPAAPSVPMWESFAGATATPGLTIGTVMRFDENKRPFAWLEIATLVLRRHAEARFVMVGDGPLLEQAVARAATLGIAHRVLFVGRTSDVGYWLHKFDLFMLLSHMEGLPNVLIEAQLAGVPVVATPAGGSLETFDPGRTGIALPSEESVDPQAVAATLVELCEDDARRRGMAHAAAEWAQAHFSIDRMAEATVQAYLGWNHDEP